jgi:hypothetical protein
MDGGFRAVEGGDVGVNGCVEYIRGHGSKMMGKNYDWL